MSSHGENRSGRSNKFFPVSLKWLCRGGVACRGYSANLILTAAYSINILPRTNHSLASTHGQKVCRVYISNAERLVMLTTTHRSHPSSLECRSLSCLRGWAIYIYTMPRWNTLIPKNKLGDCEQGWEIKQNSFKASISSEFLACFNQEERFFSIYKKKTLACPLSLYML